ncbi:hypothetical protein KR038_010530 [Drosophila bunnanda]|nr:hypothetical protein KR038_010530 [Drosophila bunnanda]
MLRSLALPPLLLLLMMMMMMSVTTDARSAKIRISTTEESVDDTTYMRLPDGTITVDIDSDLILTTSPEGEDFSEASPLELTEEPLPDSVIQQLDQERTQEERLRNPFDSDSDLETEPEETTTEKRSTKKGHRFGASTTMPLGLSPFSTPKSEFITTETAFGTTEYQEIATAKDYFKSWPATLTKGSDMEMAENRMETTTDALTFQGEKQEYVTTPVTIMTTEANLSGERVTYRDKAEPVTTQSPLLRFFTTTTAKPEVTESQPDTTTMWPETKEEATTMPTTTSTTSAPETTTSTTSAPETTISTTSAPETTTSSAPDTTTSTTSAPDTTTSTTSAPETTTSTTSAPETTTSTTNAPQASNAPETTTTTTNTPETTRTPETTTSTTSAPEASTTSTISAPLTTVPSTRAPETTTTTPRPILTRAPRVERIFNSDGVEVLYGYSSVVRTNRS